MPATLEASPLTVANTIRAQIGHRALYMMGAKNLVGSENSLSFKIRGCRSVSHIRVILDPTDTYTIEFLKIVKFDVKTTTTRRGYQADQINSVIEAETGLRLSL